MPSQDSNLKLNLSWGYLEVQCYQQTEEWLPLLDAFRAFPLQMQGLAAR